VTAVPASAVGPAYVFVIASVFVFVFFVNSIVRSMRVPYLIADVAKETAASLATVFSRPAAGGGPPGALEGPTRVLTFDRRAGAIDGIEAGELVVLATALDCVIVLQVPVGAWRLHPPLDRWLEPPLRLPFGR
jgi:uncharacterized membrane protein